MDTTTVIRGLLVFVVTFGMFVLAKPGSRSTQTASLVAEQKFPDPAPANIEPKPIESSPSQTVQAAPETPTAQIEQPQSNTEASASLESAPPEVVLLLGSWRQAIVANDPHLETSYYATTVRSYYGRSNVDAESVEADKRAFIERGNQVTGLSLQDVTLQNLSADSIRIQFTKNVAWHGPSGDIHKLIPSTLDVEKFSDGWKITGERDGSR